MPEYELLDLDKRKEKIRELTTDLSERFAQLAFNDIQKIEKLNRLRPAMMDEFWKRWEEFNDRCLQYLKGEIEWSGDSLQMEMMPLSGVLVPKLVVDRDVENYGGDLFVWFALQVKDL